MANKSAKSRKREAEVREQFATRLRLLRHEAKLTQQELALRAGLEPAYVGGVERAERNLTLRNITHIADALELPIQTLFDFRGVAK